MNISAPLLICASLLLAVAPDAQARIPRSSTAVKEFKRHNRHRHRHLLNKGTGHSVTAKFAILM